MGSADQGPAAARLLRQRAARRHGGGHAGQMRNLFRDDGRPGVRLLRCGRQLEPNCAGSARGTECGGADTGMIRIVLPPHLRALAHVGSEVKIEVDGAVTLRAALDALEASYPMLRGT